MFLGEDDILEEVGVLHKDLPVEGNVSLHTILVCCCVFGGLSMSDEKEVVLLILSVH